MADYYPLITRAVADLDENTGDARIALYERARTALAAKLRAVTPALDESAVTRQRLALEEAIRRVEGEAARTSPSNEAPTGVKALFPRRDFPRWKQPEPEPEPERNPVTDSADPLAELERLIGQGDPFADIGRLVLKEREAKRLREEAEAKRLEAEAEAKRLEAEAEAKRHEAEGQPRLVQGRQRLAEEKEARRLEAEAEARRHKAERGPRLVRARLAEVASPAPSIAPDGRLDAGPNEVFDALTEDNDDLPALRIQQRAVIKTILSSLPSNAPRHLRSPLESYDDELRARGVQPILGLLKNMAEIIEAAIGAPNARPEWLNDGMCAAFNVFSDNHALFVKHFSLDPQREDLYALTPVDESSATGSKLFGPFQEVAAASVEANKGGLTTDEFLRVVEKMAEFAKVISSLPSTEHSRDGGLPVDLIPPVSTKKRMILSGLGFFERAYDLLGTTATLASRAEANDLLTGLHNAIDALSKMI